jgi:hypothetical protein
MNMDDLSLPIDPAAPAVPQAAPPQPSSSLEQRGLSLLSTNGYDINDPKVKAAVVQVATSLRRANPGKSDDEIAKVAGPDLVTRIESAKGGYGDQLARIQAEYSPAKEAEMRAQATRNNIGTEAGRIASLGFRAGSSAAAQGALDKGYEEAKAMGNQPLADWQAKKAAALGEIEQQIKTGEADAREIQTRLQRMGLAQAIEERRDKATARATEMVPNAITSEGYRKLAAQYAPDLVAKLGDRFNQVSAAQLKALLPDLEKQYLKKLELDQKAAELRDKAEDRASRERVAGTGADARVRAAQIAAAARDRATAARGTGTGQPKIADLQRADKQVADLDKQERAVGDAATAASETVHLFDRVDGLIKKGLSTGPAVGGDNIIGKTYGFFSGNKQEADQIRAQLRTTMAKAFGGAPSDKEGAVIDQAMNVFNQDNPAASLAEVRAKFERLLADKQAEQAALQRQKDVVRSRVGDAPRGVTTKPITPSINAKGWKLMVDAQGNRAYVSPDGKHVEEVQ